MKRTQLKLSLGVLGALMLGGVWGHGLVESPPARNWFCGAVTKPDHIINNVAQYPQCEEPFQLDSNAGYQFMSVLTHAQGRSVVTPLPANVCGFDSESFNFGETVWDVPTDWPTSNLSSGRQEFLWNISWGPHFDDTEEFKYWITKTDFVFSPIEPLTWADFEDQPFCSLVYNDANPAANPDVIPLKDEAKFRTFCDVPSRQGRHVIYAEWGRNQFTYERFHGCMDVVMNPGNGNPTPVASVTISPTGPITGAGTATLDGRGSVGESLDYNWRITAPEASPYTLSNVDQAVATLTMAEPLAAQTVTVALQVSNADGSDRAEASFFHQPASAVPWVDLGPLSNAPRTLKSGDRLALRLVLDTGLDQFHPTQPIVLDGSNASADQWPLALAAAVAASANEQVAIGLLEDGVINPVADATANRVYRQVSANVVSAFLIVEDGDNFLFSDSFE